MPVSITAAAVVAITVRVTFIAGSLQWFGVGSLNPFDGTRVAGARRACDKIVADMARALIVEDEPNIRELITLHLGLEGLECVAIGDGREALGRVAVEPFDVAVLDLMLPGVDGLTICKAIRRSSVNADVPVLILTARGDEADKVVGLESGADDYLTKPFGVRELVARVRALLRRRRAADTPSDAVPAGRVIRAGDLEVDPARQQARVRGAIVDLTAHEFRLLELLASHPGIVFSREALLRRVWKPGTYVTERSVDTLVKRLRRQIEPDPAEPVYILTVWGSGYKFADVPAP
jgi:DNA-binding response OmpR family regulator